MYNMPSIHLYQNGKHATNLLYFSVILRSHAVVLHSTICFSTKTGPNLTLLDLESEEPSAIFLLMIPHPIHWECYYLLET